MEPKEIIQNLINNKNNKLYKALHVKSVRVDPKKGEYQPVKITLEEEVDTYITNENNERVIGKTNVIYTTVYNLIGFFKAEKVVNFATNAIQTAAEENPAMNPIYTQLSDAVIDVVQEFVEDGQQYVSPFSTTGKATPNTDDRYYSHIVKIVRGEQGKLSTEMLFKAFNNISM